MTNAEQIEIFQGEDGEFYWHAKAGNGEIVAQSEGYTRHEDAVRAAGETLPDVPIAE